MIVLIDDIIPLEDLLRFVGLRTMFTIFSSFNLTQLHKGLKMGYFLPLFGFLSPSSHYVDWFNVNFVGLRISSFQPFLHFVVLHICFIAYCIELRFTFTLFITFNLIQPHKGLTMGYFLSCLSFVSPSSHYIDWFNIPLMQLHSGYRWRQINFVVLRICFITYCIGLRITFTLFISFNLTQLHKELIMGYFIPFLSFVSPRSHYVDWFNVPLIQLHSGCRWRQLNFVVLRIYFIAYCIELNMDESVLAWIYCVFSFTFNLVYTVFIYLHIHLHIHEIAILQFKFLR